jgi:hypothetical protein
MKLLKRRQNALSKNPNVQLMKVNLIDGKLNIIDGMVRGGGM